jgi:hypothetical protein
MTPPVTGIQVEGLGDKAALGPGQPERSLGSFTPPLRIDSPRNPEHPDALTTSYEEPVHQGGEKNQKNFQDERPRNREVNQDPSHEKPRYRRRTPRLPRCDPGRDTHEDVKTKKKLTCNPKSIQQANLTEDTQDNPE